MAAQHLPRYLGGLAVDKRTRSNERRRSVVYSFAMKKRFSISIFRQYWLKTIILKTFKETFWIA